MSDLQRIQDYNFQVSNSFSAVTKTLVPKPYALSRGASHQTLRANVFRILSSVGFLCTLGLVSFARSQSVRVSRNALFSGLKSDENISGFLL